MSETSRDIFRSQWLPVEAGQPQRNRDPAAAATMVAGRSAGFTIATDVLHELGGRLHRTFAARAEGGIHREVNIQ